MKPQPLIAAVLAAPAAAWYVLSADTPGEFLWRVLVVAGAVAVFMLLPKETPPGLIEQELGPEKRD